METGTCGQVGKPAPELQASPETMSSRLEPREILSEKRMRSVTAALEAAAGRGVQPTLCANAELYPFAFLIPRHDFLPGHRQAPISLSGLALTDVHQRMKTA